MSAMFDHRSRPDALPLSDLDTGDDASPARLIEEALTAIRTHLGMPVAYLSEFVDDRTVFRSVSAPGLEALIKPGDQMPLSQVYCPHILNGTLPSLMPDTRKIRLCQTIEITEAIPIRSHVSLPVFRPDGTPYGMFCCLSPEPNPTLNDRDVAVMQTFANLAARQVHQIEASDLALRASTERVRQMLGSGDFQTVYQPQVCLRSGRVSGVEALTRFRAEPYRGPDKRFEEAITAGLDLDLEEATFRLATQGFADLPEEVYLSLNASPALVCDSRFDGMMHGLPLQRIVLEITEHHDAEDFDLFFRRLSSFRLDGMRVAIDDVGTGYSGLQRIARLAPDILKLDRSITRGIDGSATQRAVVAALMHFAGETGALVLAEGVETEGEAATLEALDINLVQGWFYGRPAPLVELDLRHRRGAAA